MADLSNSGPSLEVALVINLRSRWGISASQSAQGELERCGVRVKESHQVRDTSALVSAVRGAISRGVRTVVVGGGDGTVSSVVDLFAKKPELTLGLLPTGTGNEVARVLRIPLDLSDACQVVACGRVATVDLIEANGNYFVHTALIGLPAHVNHSLPDWSKFRFGKAAYAYSLLVSIVRAKPFHASVKIGNVHWEGGTVLVVVGSNRFHIPRTRLLPSSERATGGLVVYTPRESRLISLIRLAIALWITRRSQPSLLFSWSAESAFITTDPPQEVDLDGEFGQTTPVALRLVPSAVRVLVPDTPDVQ